MVSTVFPRFQYFFDNVGDTNCGDGVCNWRCSNLGNIWVRVAFFGNMLHCCSTFSLNHCPYLWCCAPYWFRSHIFIAVTVSLGKVLTEIVPRFMSASLLHFLIHMPVSTPLFSVFSLLYLIIYCLSIISPPLLSNFLPSFSCTSVSIFLYLSHMRVKSFSWVTVV